MLGNIIVGLFIVAALGAVVWVTWYENHGSEK